MLDLSTESGVSNFIAPLFQDDTLSNIKLLYPASPVRSFYLKLSDVELEEFSEFLMYYVVDNSDFESVSVQFQVSPTCAVETIELIACYNYGDYYNLQELCDWD